MASSKEIKLKRIAREIEKCAVCRRGKIGKAVAGEGNPNAKIVFIGEAPGREEAKTGRPFIGRAGKLLRSLIKEMRLPEKKIYITNPVKLLPKRGTPTKSDILHGKIHLQKQLAVINPKIIVLLGRVSQRAFFDRPFPIVKFHSRFIKKDGKIYFITLHPSAALRFLKFRKLLRIDFVKLKSLIKREI